jgi:hypothetical protein
VVQLTFPQPGDLPDAAYFAFVSGRGRSGIISGLTFTPDFTVPEVTVDPGKAVIDRGDMTTVHPNISPAETVSDAVAVVEIESQTVTLASGSVNHIFLDANVTNDDSGTVVASTTGTKPTTASLKIGEVDTNTDTATEGWNLISESGTLTYPDEQAIDSEDAQNRLSPGTLVFDRNASELFVIE